MDSEVHLTKFSLPESSEETSLNQKSSSTSRARAANLKKRNAADRVYLIFVDDYL